GVADGGFARGGLGARAGGQPGAAGGHLLPHPRAGGRYGRARSGRHVVAVPAGDAARAAGVRGPVRHAGGHLGPALLPASPPREPPGRVAGGRRLPRPERPVALAMLIICPVLALGVVCAWRGRGAPLRASLQTRLSSLALFVLSCALVVLPWTVRN